MLAAMFVVPYFVTAETVVFLARGGASSDDYVPRWRCHAIVLVQLAVLALAWAVYVRMEGDCSRAALILPISPVLLTLMLGRYLRLHRTAAMGVSIAAHAAFLGSGVVLTLAASVAAPR